MCFDATCCGSVHGMALFCMRRGCVYTNQAGEGGIRSNPGSLMCVRHLASSASCSLVTAGPYGCFFGCSCIELADPELVQLPSK
jgi:hypothetical protein